MKKWFENLKISKKLIFGFLIAAIIAAIVGILGIVSVFEIRDSGTMLYKENTLGLDYLGNAHADFNNVRYTSLKLTTAETASEKEQYIAEINETCASVDDLLAKYEGTYLTSEITTEYKNTESDWAEYKSDIEQVMQTGSIDAETLQLGDLIETSFEQLMNVDVPDAELKCDSNLALAQKSAIIMTVAMVFGIVISLFLGFYISGIISKPMQKFALFAEMLAVGDIEVEKVIDEKDMALKLRKDEVGILAESFNKIIASTIKQAHETQAIAAGDLTTVVTVRSEKDVLGKALSNLVMQFHNLAANIVSSASQVDSGAKQVSESSTSLAQGAAEQASSVEELTASLEEITSQTTQNAQNAQSTDKLAKNIKMDAETGNAQMAEMLRAMDEINASSDNISKIIKVIEDIAFQTNILALNAAVEAARAGQYGKGFAVVAEEVRNLAGQSSKAAKETTELIENSIQKVGAGTRIAKETAGALGKIMEEISKVTGFIDNIATASNEQSTALEQINQGIMQVSQVVQTNAASAEECAAASEELSGQADSLKTNVSIFKLNSSFANDINPHRQKSSGSEKQKEKSRTMKDRSNPSISLSGSDFGKYE